MTRSTAISRRKDAKPELKQVIFRFKKDPLATTHPVVADPSTWLRGLKIGVADE